MAQDEGLALNDGPICILGPRAGEAFGALPASRIQIVTGYRPDHDFFAQAGFTVSTHLPGTDTVLICLPRAKAAGLALIAAAAAAGAQHILVDGQKTDGIESVLKAVRARVALDGSIAKAHGKLFWFRPAGVDFSDWLARAHRVDDPELGAFQTLPGVFSADGVDPASALLARHLPATLPAHMADLGAGWGYLTTACLARTGVQQMHLVEAEASALDLARANIADPRAEFHWADACTVALPGPLDAVVMNPPFHIGRKAEPALGLAFIAAAARLLGARGKLWMVGNRHLPYDTALSEHFVTQEILAETSAFRVWQASTPRRASKTTARMRGQRTYS